MSLKPDIRRASHARDRLGSHLDDIESRFMPAYVGKIARAWMKYQAARHPVGWAIGTTATLATILGLVGWAVFSKED